MGQKRKLTAVEEIMLAEKVRRSESPIRVAYPNHVSESPIRVTYPSHISQSLI